MKGKQNRKKTTRKQRRKQTAPRSLSMASAYFDFDLQSLDITSSAVQYSLLTTLLSSSGLMQGYPQHAKPYLTAFGKGLRQRLKLTFMELNYIIVGSQSNALTYADVYNTVRVAVLKTGFAFSAVNPLYLQSVLSGVNLQAAKKIYHDRIHALPTLAFSTGNYNSPSVATVKTRIKLNETIDVYSTNATGVGASWDTNGIDFDLNLVSDSIITPNPMINLSCRIWFKYL